MKPIIIQGAMNEEVNLLRDNLIDLKCNRILGLDFYEGYIDNYPIIVAKTDVGEINSSMSTTIAIEKYDPALVINQGIAGGSSEKVHRKDIIIGKSCININSYITPEKESGEGSNSLDWELQTFRSEEGDLIKYVSDTNVFNKIQNTLNTLYGDSNVYYGTLGSGDVWNNEIDRIHFLNQKYGILSEDMESIATYKICNSSNIPVLGYRMISNNILTNEKYDKEIAQELQKFSLHILKMLIKEMEDK